MAKKKSANTARAGTPAPVAHGDVFVTFLKEAASIGNEVTARRAYDAEVVAFLKERGLLDEWAAWYDARRAQKP